MTVPALRLAEHLDACPACRSWHRLATLLPVPPQPPATAPELPEPTGIHTIPYSVRARLTGHGAGANLVRLALVVEAVLLTLGIGWPAWTIVLTCCATIAASVVATRWRRQAPESGADAGALPIELPPGVVPGRSRLRLISGSEPELPR